MNISALFTNAGATARSMVMGVAAVAHGATAPTTPDYQFAANNVSLGASATITYPLNVVYGSGADHAPAGVTGSKDFYVMAQASAGLAVLPSGLQMTVSDG